MQQDFASALESSQRGGDTADAPAQREPGNRPKPKRNKPKRPAPGAESFSPFAAPSAPSPEPAGQKRRPGRRAVLAGIGAAAVLAAGAAVGLPLLAPSPAASTSPGIAAAVPADADTVLVAKPEQRYWTELAKFAPLDFNLGTVNLADAHLDLASIGYSRSPEPKHSDQPFPGPTRIFYAEGTDEAAATKAESYLKDKLATANARVYRSGRFVAVTQSWITSFAVPDHPVTTAPGFRAAGYGPGMTMWVGFGALPSALSGGDAKRRDLLAEYTRKAFGLKDGTAWLGSSPDGVVFNGAFTSGGFDSALVDLNGLRNDLQQTEQTLMEGEQPGRYPGTVQHYKLQSSGMTGLVNDAGFFIADGGKVVGSDPRTGGYHAVSGEKLAVVVVPPRWNASATGETSFMEGVVGLRYSIAESAMTLGVEYLGS